MQDTRVCALDEEMVSIREEWMRRGKGILHTTCISERQEKVVKFYLLVDDIKINGGNSNTLFFRRKS